MIRFFKVFMVFVLFIGAHYAIADDRVYTATFANTALNGYDTVAYFTENKPIKGLKDHRTEWNGAQWHFSSKENLSLFTNNPEKYAPQYGGYCAFAVANGSTAPGDPNQWHIQNGKLYLNLNANIQQKWLANRDNFIHQADKNYPSLVK